MNCKPGDLAIVVRSYNGNEGRLVTCVRARLVDFVDRDNTPAWETVPMLINSDGRKVPVPDSNLRPIRDPGDDAVDEVLQLLPVPHKEMA